MNSDSVLFPELHAARYGDSHRRKRRLILPRRLFAAAESTRLKGDSQDRAYGIIRKWAELERSRKLESLSETQLELEFLTEVFGDALGYALFSANADAWELQPKFRVNGGVADAAIGSFAPGSAAPRVLIELKGPTVNVDRSAGGRTPVQQLWDYLNAQPDCPWGIVCNYVSFRLYHRDHTPRAFEIYTLADMDVRPELFREFYALFQRDGLLRPYANGEPRADRLLRESGERQREVGDELYELYRQQRAELIQHLHQEHGKSVDDAIRIAQRLIDRIIFIAFCEDRELIASKALRRAWEQLDPYHFATNPRWKNFLNLFRAVDRGHKNLGVEHGYNGNLFKPDPEIDNLELEDGWTKFFRDVGEYDFRDEVNVDVLGNLFERSITELERMRVSGLFGAQDAEKPPALMPKSAQRKRFGVYYTPPEFTQLIVEQTVGALMRESRATAEQRAGVRFDEAPAGQDAGAARRALHVCIAAARELKIVDPACGSGAFLIAAYDLLEERYHELIDRLQQFDEPQDSVRQLRDAIPEFILNDNLYGVDLSREAVEITQLALWIRSARPGRTLADLSQHIRHGNSLVDEPAVDSAAFNWREQFAAVFDRTQGGFDCVIGNPPWERLKLQEREFFSLSAPEIASAVSAAKRREMIAALETANPALFERYQQAKDRTDRLLNYARGGRYPLTGRGDVNTYMLFAELARSIVAPEGLVGLLVPSGIATDDTTKEFFAALMESKALRLLYDFENRERVFPEVDGRFKFCTLVFGGAKRKRRAADFVFFARRMEDLKPKQRHIPLSSEDLALLNPNTRTCPIFRTRRDAELTRGIYRIVPILIDRAREAGGNPWGIRFFTMFHQTNDAELFHDPGQLSERGFKRSGNRWKKGKQVFLPLYEAKMIQAYDHRAAGVVVEDTNWMRQGQTKETSLVQHQNPEFTVEPRWWVDQSAVLRALLARDSNPAQEDGDAPGASASGSDDPPIPPALLAYKDVTSPTNQRTMIAAFIPFSAVVNSAPIMLFGDDVGWRRAACLLANLNSFALDFAARQKVGGLHLNFFIVEQLPVLPPDRYADKCPWNKRLSLERWISDRVLKLTCTANDMIPLAEAAGFDERVHKWKPEERAQLRAELDAAFFHLYGVGREDVEYMLSTFQGLRDAAEPLSGESTTGQILAEFDRLAGA
ncbi:MAG: N-6 DNA methylase [Phycisphaerae bacterium]